MRINLKAAKLAALLAVVPVASACSLTVDGRMGEETATASASASAAETAAPSETSVEPSVETPTPEPTVTDAPSPEQTSEPSATDSAEETTTPAGQRIPVPTGSGITSMELVDIYGSDSSGGGYGRAVGVFKVTTDRPLLIKLRLALFDAAGKQIATNDGLNPAYRVGSYTLVTSNLIKLPEGVTPKSFKVSLVDTTNMDHPVFSRFDEPRIKDRAGTPILTGTFTFTGEMRSGMDSRGACILPNGNIVSGTENLVDNPTTSADGGARTGTYEIPLYDAAKLDLSQATCYASV